MRSSTRGFTLLELMITVAIISIVGGIGLTSYNEQKRRGYRQEALTAILNTQNALERCYSNTRNYNSSDTACSSIAATFNSPSNHYQITVTRPNSNDAYIITASAIGTQTADKDCLTIQLTSTGDKSGSTNAFCWGK